MNSISVNELDKKIKSGEPVILLDIRLPEERNICQIPGSQFLPMNEVADYPEKLSREIPTVVYCHHGIRSFILIKFLREEFGFTNLINLDGGINEWAHKVDHSMARY